MTNYERFELVVCTQGVVIFTGEQILRLRQFELNNRMPYANVTTKCLQSAVQQVCKLHRTNTCKGRVVGTVTAQFGSDISLEEYPEGLEFMQEKIVRLCQ